MTSRRSAANERRVCLISRRIAVRAGLAYIGSFVVLKIILMATH